MRKIVLYACIIGFSNIGCNKAEFLNHKPRTSLIVPTTIADFQKLLDNSDMNVTGALGEISADNYYLISKKALDAVSVSSERNAYTWAQDLYQGRENIEDWNLPYKQILNANVVLEGLERNGIQTQDKLNYDWIKGWALFIRGHALFNLAQHFTMPYNDSTAANSLGLPLRTQADVTVVSVRASLKQTYVQILEDLHSASQLLPIKEPGLDRNRPYSVAAYAMLARVYLSMNKYELALLNANNALKLYAKLIDFNNLSATESIPIGRLNTETLFNAQFTGVGTSLIIGTYRISPNVAVDSVLYKSYQTNDLRKNILFATVANTGKPGYKASYVGTTRPFSGIATDEIFLIKAECEIRTGDYLLGLNTLDQLLVYRWKSGTYTKQTAGGSSEALTIVLNERRKELPFRGLRWQDIRRLNAAGAGIIPTRLMEGTSYVLPVNSLRYALPIPPDEIRLSGIEQNPR